MTGEGSMPALSVVDGVTVRGGEGEASTRTVTPQRPKYNGPVVAGLEAVGFDHDTARALHAAGYGIVGWAQVEPSHWEVIPI